MHTVPQIMGSLRMVVTPSRTLRWGERPPTPLSVVVALTLIEIRCSHRVSLLRSHQMTSRFPPPGPPEKRSPVSTVLSGCYDALRPSRRTSYSFAWRYRSGCHLIRSFAGVGHHTPAGRDIFIAAVLGRFDGRRQQGLPRSWGTHTCVRRVRRPRWNRLHQAILRCSDAAPGHSHYEGFHDCDFGAQ